MSVLPSRFLRFRFLPRERLCRRFAFPALILPEPVMRKRFTALRFVFNFGILRIPSGSLRKTALVHAPSLTVKPSAPRRAGQGQEEPLKPPSLRSPGRLTLPVAAAADATRARPAPWPAETAATADSGRES